MLLQHEKSALLLPMLLSPAFTQTSACNSKTTDRTVCLITECRRHSFADQYRQQNMPRNQFIHNRLCKERMPDIDSVCEGIAH